VPITGFEAMIRSRSAHAKKDDNVARNLRTEDSARPCRVKVMSARETSRSVTAPTCMDVVNLSALENALMLARSAGSVRADRGTRPARQPVQSERGTQGRTSTQCHDGLPG